jgi:hypothetical protein
MLSVCYWILRAPVTSVAQCQGNCDCGRLEHSGSIAFSAMNFKRDLELHPENKFTGHKCQSLWQTLAAAVSSSGNFRA